MIKVDNQKIVQRVARQTYGSNRKRNIMTILAVILTTFLIVSVIGIGIAYWQMIAERQIKMNGMDYDIELSEPTEAQVTTAKKMNLVKDAGVCVKCAILDSANGKKLSKVQLYWLDNTCWEKQCLPALDVLTGNYPQKEDEILLSAEALRDMGITAPKIGMSIDVTYFPLTGELSDEEHNSYTFRLSGYYTDFTGNSRGYVSDAFYKTTGANQTDFTQGTLKLTLKNPVYSQKTILSMQEEFKLRNQQYLAADYDSISEFIKFAVVLAGVLVLIFVSAYLFIYNTLYISVTKDIRYYGQLKTIGMTSVQIRGVIYRQALWNGSFGIPAGLLLGYMVSKKLIPIVMQIQNPDMAATASFTYYPPLFLMATVFASVTIFISSRKPAKMAGNCSPIEAVRFIEETRKSSRSENGLSSMAWRNMFRDKKKAMFVLGSFIVSMTIFFTVNVVIKGNDSKSILNQIYSYDISFVNETVPEDAKHTITEEDVKQIRALEGIENARAVYSSYIKLPYQEDVFGSFYKELYQSRYAPGDYEKDILTYKNNQDIHGFFDSKIIGVDDTQLNILLKEANLNMDMEKFHNGEIALTSDFITIRPEDALGKQVSFSLRDTEQTQTVQIAGIVQDPSEFASGYTPVIIVSHEWYEKIVSDPIIELVYTDYASSLDKETEHKVKEVFAGSKNVSVNSKLSRYNDMLSSERQIRILGNGIGLIIAFLAILNYINIMTAGVYNRKREFATLESIGMTSKQIQSVLVKEGLGYAGISIVFSLLMGIPISFLVFQSMNIYRISYVIPVIPNLILFTSVILICLAVPVVVFMIANRGSVLERLREDEN